MHAAACPHWHAPADEQLFARVVLQVWHITPLMPQLVVLDVLHVVPEQQPVAHEVAVHTQAPPEHA